MGSIKDEKRGANRVRLGEIIPQRMADGEVRDPEPRRINTGDVYEDLKETIDMIKLRTLGQTIGGMALGQPQGSAQNDDGLERLAKVGNLLGIDFTELTKTRQQEVESLRRELDETKKQQIQTRLDAFDKTISDINSTIGKFMEEQKNGSRQPQGFFGQADQMTGGKFSEMLLMRMLGGAEEKKQEDPIDAFLRQLEFSERVKKMLGLEKPEKPPFDPGLVAMGKVDILKTILEDERMRAGAEKEYALQQMKMEKLGGFLNEIKSYIPDAIEALKGRSAVPAAQPPAQAAREPQRVATPVQDKPTQPPPEGGIKLQSAAKLPPPDQLIYEEIECPNDGCHKPVPFPVNVPAGLGIECPHCRKTIYRIDEAKESTPEGEGEKQ